MARREDFFTRHLCAEPRFDERIDICPRCRRDKHLEEHDISVKDAEILAELEYYASMRNNVSCPGEAIEVLDVEADLKAKRAELFG